MDDIKTIVYTHTEHKNKPVKEKKKRIVASEKQWLHAIKDNDLLAENQCSLFHMKDKKQTILHREIRRKIDGYKRQDMAKNLWNEECFVDFPFVLNLLQEQPNCFYCRKPVKLLYDISRDPEQWTLERIENNQGHNKENVKVSCLSCNLSRRTMYHEKYRFTKQIQFVKEVV